MTESSGSASIWVALMVPNFGGSEVTPRKIGVNLHAKWSNVPLNSEPKQYFPY